MKKLLSLLFFCFILSFSHAQVSGLLKLQGRWESPEGGGLEVKDSSQIYIVYGEEKKKVASFEADFTKSPCWLDLTIQDGKETLTMKTLLLFVNDRLLQWQVFVDGTRPANFSSDKGEMVYLRKKE